MVFDKNATYALQKIVLIFPDFIRENLNEIILNNLLNYVWMLMVYVL